MLTNETHNKIILALKNNGPSLPIHIAKKVGMSSLFVSAFLSELIAEKKVKISSLKVGGSHLYFLEGQEEQLEKFYTFLHPKEAETFLLLKEKRILKDSEQEPAIRVALRNIRDFAVGFRKNDEIYWKYLPVPESEIIEFFATKLPPQVIKPSVEELSKKETIIEEKPKKTLKKPKEKIEKIKEKPDLKSRPIEIKPEEKLPFINPLAIKQETPIKKENEKSEFVLEVIETIEKHNFKVIEELDSKAREYHCILQMPTPLGPMNFLTEAKDKKKLAETDLEKLLIKAQSIPLPALMICPGELNKKAKEYAEKYSSILKILKID